MLSRPMSGYRRRPSADAMGARRSGEASATDPRDRAPELSRSCTDGDPTLRIQRFECRQVLTSKTGCGVGRYPSQHDSKCHERLASSANHFFAPPPERGHTGRVLGNPARV